MKLAEAKIGRIQNGWLYKGEFLYFEEVDKFLKKFSVCGWGIKRFWVQAHDRPSKDRVKASVRTCTCCPSCKLPMLVIGRRLFVDSPFDDVLKPFVGKTIWLELWYEEGK